MTPIYEPKGRAGEYAHLAVNLYQGCRHGCSYCYGPSALRKSRADFVTGDTGPRPGVIEAMQKQAVEYVGTDSRVLLCFTSDPYQPGGIENGVTRQALEILRRHDIPYTVLTKGGMRAARDFDLYGRCDAFGASLTYVNHGSSRVEEPVAVTPFERCIAL